MRVNHPRTDPQCVPPSRAANGSRSSRRKVENFAEQDVRRSGFHINERTQSLIDRGQHSGGRLDQQTLLKRVDQSACESVNATGAATRNRLRILVDASNATTDTGLRALKCAGNTADRKAAHKDTLANRSCVCRHTIERCAAGHMWAARGGALARHNVSAQASTGGITAAGLNLKSYSTV